MKKVMVIGCGAYMESGYGCPGEWRCLKAAAMGEGEFDEPVQVISLVKCECPGRSVAPNAGMAIKLSELKPDVIHLSSCMVNAKPIVPTGRLSSLPRSSKRKPGYLFTWELMSITDRKRSVSTRRRSASSHI
jgi:predicted metal-binding protein